MVLNTSYGTVDEMIRLMAKNVKLAEANFIMIKYIMGFTLERKQTLRTSYKKCRVDDNFITNSLRKPKNCHRAVPEPTSELDETFTE